MKFSSASRFIIIGGSNLYFSIPSDEESDWGQKEQKSNLGSRSIFFYQIWQEFSLLHIVKTFSLLTRIYFHQLVIWMPVRRAEEIRSTSRCPCRSALARPRPTPHIRWAAGAFLVRRADAAQKWSILLNWSTYAAARSPHKKRMRFFSRPISSQICEGKKKIAAISEERQWFSKGKYKETLRKDRDCNGFIRVFCLIHLEYHVRQNIWNYYNFLAKSDEVLQNPLPLVKLDEIELKFWKHAKFTKLEHPAK